MNCSNIGDYLDVASAHDWWKDSKTLMMPECRIENSRSLDMGFNRCQTHWIWGSLLCPILTGHQLPHLYPSWTWDFHLAMHSIPMISRSRQPALRTSGQTIDWPVAQTALWTWVSIHLRFNTVIRIWTWAFIHIRFNRVSIHLRFNTVIQIWTWVFIHLRFNIRPSGIDPVDIPDQSVGLQSEETPLDMGFGTDPAHDFAHHLNIQPEETPLEMGFETLDPVHGLPYQSPMVSEPEPMGFVIQRTVGDLRLAIHWLEMERAHGTMSPEEALVSEEVLQATIHSMKCDDYALCM
ncbi:hypothetical protein EV424DRAFT_1345736 [Suillus variegatus]|nr:hypothetical protein EV424DRAFT_1345736 [Suillus variegatus]